MQHRCHILCWASLVRFVLNVANVGSCRSVGCIEFATIHNLFICFYDYFLFLHFVSSAFNYTFALRGLVAASWNCQTKKIFMAWKNCFFFCVWTPGSTATCWPNIMHWFLCICICLMLLRKTNMRFIFTCVYFLLGCIEKSNKMDWKEQKHDSDCDHR